MKKISLGQGEMCASAISLGVMRIPELGEKEAEKHIRTAMELGIDFFDNADIYGGGKAEEIFSGALGMNDGVRERVLIQSKCGIGKGCYDFSKEHILEAVDGSLRRLRTEYLDVLLLHRPDALMEPEEVAQAFNILQGNGKVRFFGVSNQNPMQIELLQQSVGQRLMINQLQLSITNTGMIDAGINVNTAFPGSVDHDGGILDYCRLKKITIQPWSPFQYGFFEGVFLGSDKYPELNKAIRELAKEKGVTDSAIAVAWLLRHPARMQPIVGTMNTARLAGLCKAADIELTRQEWYKIYLAAGNKLP